MIWRLKAAMIGVTRMVCATIIACGVNRMPNEPSGPERDSNRYTASPTTTGGSPISAFRTTIAASRPRNRFSARNAPNGTPRIAASATALRLTISEI